MSLKERRLAVGLTQEQVAKKIGVQQSTVSRWDSGVIPHRAYRRNLAKLYNCTLEDIAAAYGGGKDG